mmetsp:Transcript_27363/g.75440  ORF Transcript_27363/g.75440 Transcript_27363/m.75440 type:complete len:1063 (+) Transcript_27363:49-3237(+)
MRTKWIPPYLGMVLFCLLAFRQAPALLEYGKDAVRHDWVHTILTNPLSSLAHHHHRGREKTSILGNGDSQSDGLWLCQYGLVHVVQTRFMERQAHLHDLAQARLKLFETFTLPSMMQQTTKQFLWIIWTDTSLNGAELERMIQLVARVPNAVLMTRDSTAATAAGPSSDFRSLVGIPESDVKRHLLEGNAKLLMDYYRASQSRLLVETRLDADDAVTRTFVESIQSHAARTIGQQVDNEKRIQVFCPEHHVEWRYYKPNDEENEDGWLIHFENKQICINSGLSIAYHLSASQQQLQFFDTASQSYNNVQQKIPMCDGGGLAHLRGGLRASDEEAQLVVRHKKLVQQMMERQQQEAAQLQTAAEAVVKIPGEEAEQASADFGMNHLSLRHRQEAQELSAKMEDEIETLQARVRKRHPHYANARNSNECWRALELVGQDKQSVNTFQVAIVLARTPTAAGMNNVLPRRQFTSRYSMELPTYESPEDQKLAWDTIMAVEFHLHANAVRQMRVELEQHMKNIIVDALSGQCTKGHSCKPSAKKALLGIVDMLDERESSETDENGVVSNSALLEKRQPSLSHQGSFLRKAWNMVVNLMTTTTSDHGESSTSSSFDYRKSNKEVEGNDETESSHGKTWNMKSSAGDDPADGTIGSDESHERGSEENSHARDGDAGTTFVVNLGDKGGAFESHDEAFSEKGEQDAAFDSTNVLSEKEVDKDTEPRQGESIQPPASGEVGKLEQQAFDSPHQPISQAKDDNSATDSKSLMADITQAAKQPKEPSSRLETRDVSADAPEAKDSSEQPTRSGSWFGRLFSFARTEGALSHKEAPLEKAGLGVAPTMEERTIVRNDGADKAGAFRSEENKTNTTGTNSNSATVEAVWENQVESSALKNDETTANAVKVVSRSPQEKAKQNQKPKAKPQPKTKRPTKILHQGVDREYIVPNTVKDIRDLTDKTYEAEVYIKSDDHPEHISFTLYNARTQTIVAERNSTVTGEKIFAVPLQTGHYSFEIRDSKGDGLCCNGDNKGRFEFYVNKKLLSEGSDFGFTSGKKEFKLYTNGFNKRVDSE